MDVAGKPKPIYYVLKNLFPKIAAGARVVKSSDQSAGEVYGAAFLVDDQLTIIMANDEPETRRQAVRLDGVSNVIVEQATACLMQRKGKPAKKEADLCAIVPANINIRSQNRLDLSLPGYSTLAITCNVSHSVPANECTAK